MIAFFIQARASSSRLPRKTIIPLWNGKSMLQLIVQRINHNFPDNKIYLLTTVNPADDELVESLNGYPLTIFRGDENDVMGRFVQAALKHKVSDIIRVCGDNPFLLPEYMKKLLNDTSGADYVSFSYNGIPAMKCHFGFFTERIKTEALIKAHSITNDSIYLEHVTNYIYENPTLFNTIFYDTTRQLASISNLRLTVDTKEDFDSAAFLLNKLADPNLPLCTEIINLVNQYPDILQKMTSQIKNNEK